MKSELKIIHPSQIEIISLPSAKDLLIKQGMSSLNPHFTMNYSQPGEYAFSHDSVFVARRVFELLEGQSLSGFRGLDLCAGCGVIGMDFLFHRRQAGRDLPAHFDFLEVQEIYHEHFQRNWQLGDFGLPGQFLQENYLALQAPEFHQRYDLILCNPPYFRPGQGKLSPSDFKNRCRFFLDADFTGLVRGIAAALHPEGRAFMLLRDLADHAWSPFREAEEILGAGPFAITKIGDVRGTDLVEISRRR